jgi:hypothetical protein
VAAGVPRKTAGMSDREWCVQTERYWRKAGMDTSEMECQGEPMSFWLGENF